MAEDVKKVEAPKAATDAEVQKALDHLKLLEDHAKDVSLEKKDGKIVGHKVGYNPHLYISKVIFPASQALVKGVTAETVAAILALKKEDEPTVKKYYVPVIKQ